MDITKHPILQEALAKRDAALGEAKYWDRFIEDYKTLSKVSTETPPTRPVLAVVTPPQARELSWPEMRKIAEEILREKNLVKNAAAFVQEFAKRGYVVKKENLSQALTHAKKHHGMMDYEKDRGGWFLTQGDIPKVG